jgi:predicted component of type VI protein secretion system
MQISIITLICLLLLVGCGKHEPQKQPPYIRIALTNDPSRTNAGSHSKQPLSVSFTIGSDRDAVSRELEQIHATILKDSPEVLRAEFQAPTRMVQVELSFVDGKVTKVNYIPQ